MIKKKLTAWVLTFCMVLTLLPAMPLVSLTAKAADVPTKFWNDSTPPTVVDGDIVEISGTPGGTQRENFLIVPDNATITVVGTITDATKPLFFTFNPLSLSSAGGQKIIWKANITAVSGDMDTSTLVTTSDRTTSPAEFIMQEGSIIAKAGGAFRMGNNGHKLTMNGGVISTESTVESNAAVSSGGEVSVTVNSGTVKATGDGGTAIFLNSSDGRPVIINGGVVSATTGRAIYANGANDTITINGGVVFAQSGLISNSNNTQDMKVSPANRSVIRRRDTAPAISVTAPGVIIGWTGSETNAAVGTSVTNLISSPTGVTAVWAVADGKSGMNYTGDGISGFVEVDGVTVTGGATVPDAPTGVSASAGNAQATVSFTPPVSDGGASITGYTVTSSPGGITATGTASPITVTGLTNGQVYTFTVTATNGVGTGAASASSNTVTPMVPVTSVNWTGNASTIQAIVDGWEGETGRTINISGVLSGTLTIPSASEITINGTATSNSTDTGITLAIPSGSVVKWNGVFENTNSGDTITKSGAGVLQIESGGVVRGGVESRAIYVTSGSVDVSGGIVFGNRTTGDIIQFAGGGPYTRSGSGSVITWRGTPGTVTADTPVTNLTTDPAGIEATWATADGRHGINYTNGSNISGFVEVHGVFVTPASGSAADVLRTVLESVTPQTYIATENVMVIGAIVLGASHTIDTSGNEVVLAGTISDGGGAARSITKTGAGELILSTPGNSTYSGGTIVNGGILTIMGDGSLGAASGGLTLNGGALATSAVAITINRAITLGTGGGTFLTRLNMTFNGAISGPGKLSKTGTTLTLTNSSNSYTGGTEIIGDFVINSSIPATGNSIIGTGGLTLDGGTLNVTGTGYNVSRNIALTAGGGTVSGNFPFTVSGDISGIGNFTKTGTGTLTISGANTYSGNTIINGGTVIIGNYTVPASIPFIINNGSALTVNNGIMLTNNGTITNDGIINLDGTLNGTGTIINTNGLILTGESSVAESLNRLVINANSGLIGGESSITVAEPGTTFDLSKLVTYSMQPSNSGFIFTGWNTMADGSGTAYAANASVPFTAGTIFAQWIPFGIYSISINTIGTHTLKAATFAYSANTRPSVSVTVTNTGNQPVSGLNVSIEGANFEVGAALNRTSLTVTGTNRTATFTVRPNIGLPVGTHRATVTVSGDNVTEQSFDVAFTVNKRTGAALRVNPAVNSANRTDTSLTVSNVSAIAPTSANNPGGQSIQYAITTSSSSSMPSTLVWQSSTEFTELRPSTNYYIWARTAADGNCDAGKARRSGVIKTPAPEQAISLNKSGTHTFKAATLNAAPPAALSVKVNSIGTASSGDLKVELSGFDADKFVLGGLLTENKLESITKGKNSSFTIRPNPNLEVGTYTAKVTVSGIGTEGSEAADVSFVVSFTVNRLPGAALGTKAVPTVAHKDTTSITVNPPATLPVNPGNQELQYAITTSNSKTAPSTLWQSFTEGDPIQFTGLPSATNHYVWVRYGQKDNYSAGTARCSAVIRTDAVDNRLTLSRTDTHTFATRAFGVTPPSALTVTVNNRGKLESGELTVTLSGDNAEHFALGGSALQAGNKLKSLKGHATGNGGSSSFTVRPRANLLVSSEPYTATVTVSNSDNSFSESFDLSFTVTGIGTGAKLRTAPRATADTTSITVNNQANMLPNHPGGQTIVEYAITTSSSSKMPSGLVWITFLEGEDVTFTDLRSNTTYYVWARMAENENCRLGAATRSGAIKTKIPTHGVILSRSGINTFGSLWNTAPPSLSVSVSSATGASGVLSIEIIGDDAEFFELAGNALQAGDTLKSIAKDKNSSFSVRPVTGLDIGREYKAAVVVTGENSSTKDEFELSFEISYTMSLGTGATVNSVPFAKEVTDSSIEVIPVLITGINPGGQEVEYAVSTNSSTSAAALNDLVWDEFIVDGNSIKFIGLSSSTTYYVFARSAESSLCAAGAVRRSAAIRTDVKDGDFTLSISGEHTFTQGAPGYATPSALTVTVNNAGRLHTGALSVTFADTATELNEFFEVRAQAVEAGVPAYSSRMFTVRPKTELPVGTYEATVIVSNESSTISHSFDVKFVVSSVMQTTLSPMPQQSIMPE